MKPFKKSPNKKEYERRNDKFPTRNCNKALRRDMSQSKQNSEEVVVNKSQEGMMAVFLKALEI